MATTPSTPIITDDTGLKAVAALERIAAATEATGGTSSVPVWDSENGCYTNASIAAWLGTKASGDLFGYSMPKGSSTAITKLGSIAGYANPVPSTLLVAGSDPYASDGDFFHVDVNAEVNADGTAKVTAIEGDGRFERDGSNGDVWVLTHTYYTRTDDLASTVEVWFSTSQYGDGLSPQPGAKLPDGSVRPFMLYAKYAGCKGSDGLMHSYSGYPLWNRSTSHDTLKAQTKSDTTGYSGKSYADDWYVRTMFRLKYGTKNTQSVFYGCANYSSGYAPALAETGVNRVVLTTAQAANFVVGGSVMLGTAGATGKSVDRGAATAYDKFDARRITAIEAVDDSNSALVIEGDAFDTLATDWVQTAPWHSGSCDGVQGDGSPSSCTSGKEPFTLQGVECMVGAYEVLHDVILQNTGDGWSVLTLADTQTSSVNSASAYEDTGLDLPTDSADSWKYPLYDVEAGGMLVPQGTGASQSTGLCDGCYTNKLATTGTREWLSFGNFGNGGHAGLSCVDGNSELSGAWWHIASRLSGNGRSKG